MTVIRSSGNNANQVGKHQLSGRSEGGPLFAVGNSRSRRTACCHCSPTYSLHSQAQCSYGSVNASIATVDQTLLLGLQLLLTPYWVKFLHWLPDRQRINFQYMHTHLPCTFINATGLYTILHSPLIPANNWLGNFDHQIVSLFSIPDSKLILDLGHFMLLHLVVGTHYPGNVKSTNTCTC